VPAYPGCPGKKAVKRARARVYLIGLFKFEFSNAELVVALERWCRMSTTSFLVD